MKKFLNHSCLKCGYPLYDSVHDFSVNKYDFPLCKRCQDWFTQKTKATEYAKRLYLALKQRNIPAELEKHDGHKTIDIVITCLKINIEVDGSQHNMDSEQALSDLKRTKYSHEKGFSTLRIPNALIRDYIEETADEIVDILQAKKEKLEKEKRNYINETDISPKELQLYELITDFLSWFHLVFEEDWEYAKEYIKSENAVGILSVNHLNWGNKENMLKAFYKLIEFMKENRIFDLTIPDPVGYNTDAERGFDIARCYFEEFIDDIPKDLF